MWYKVEEGMWAWLLHRLTGVGILVFLFLHIADTALIGWGPKVYNAVLAIYRAPLFRLGEVALFGAVLFHALNGIRIMIVDFCPGATVHQRRMFYAVVALFVVLFLPVMYLMLKPVLRT